MTEDIRAALLALDQPGWRAMEPALETVYELGDRIFPEAIDAYSELRGWRGRAAIVFAASSFARENEDAVSLGLRALTDRSGHVRSHACMLLLLAGRPDTIPSLEALLTHTSERTRDDAERAIRTIRAGAAENACPRGPARRLLGAIHHCLRRP